MKKRILLISYNYYPEPTGIGKYNGDMIQWFGGQGYDCTVVTSYPYYPFWKVQEPYYKKRFWYSTEEEIHKETKSRLKIFRCPQYVPLKPSGLKRILLDLSFLVSASFPLLWLMSTRKFDYILTVAPSFQVGLLGVLFKKIRKAKLIYHVQDMQIEAARDLKMIKSKWLISALFKFEKFIFKQSEIVSSISDGMVKKIQKKAKKDVLLFPNWADTRIFFPIKNRLELRKHFGYLPTDKIVVYSGSIGEKQGLESILHAANELRQSKEIKFIICGSGPYTMDLQKLAKNLRLDNLNFLPIQPVKKLNEFLNIADLHLIIQKAGASDLVMPSKLTTILSVGGLALATTNKGSGLYNVLIEHDLGLFVEAENQTALNEGILNAVNGDFVHLSKNAREYAETFLSIDKIMGDFEEHMIRPGKIRVPIINSTLPKSPDTHFKSTPHGQIEGSSKIPVELINPAGNKAHTKTE